MENIKKQILNGKIFIYPTDTIYGLGCNALDVGAVEKIKKIKGRDENKPMSVIAPSFDWICENCIVEGFGSQFGFRDNTKPAQFKFWSEKSLPPTLSGKIKNSSDQNFHPPKIAKTKLIQSSPETDDSYLKKYLPGPYTIILKKKNSEFLKHVASGKTLGVRIPDCDFTSVVQEAGVPFITTSVNLSGEKPACKINEIDEKILKQVDVIVDAGVLDGRPSTLIIEGEQFARD